MILEQYFHLINPIMMITYPGSIPYLETQPLPLVADFRTKMETIPLSLPLALVLLLGPWRSLVVTWPWPLLNYILSY